MSKNDIFNACRELFDSITITKGYLQVQLKEDKNYGNQSLPELLQFLSETETRFRKIVDRIEQSD